MLRFGVLTTEPIIMMFCIHIVKATEKDIGYLYPEKNCSRGLEKIVLLSKFRGQSRGKKLV